jgi:type I restriction enzyme, S subunit
MWESVAIQDVCSLITRGISPAYASSGIPVLSQKCVRDHRILLEAARITDPQRKKVPRHKLLQLYDVLVNSTGVGTLGRVAQVKAVPELATVDSHVSIVRPDPVKIDPRFFGYAMIVNQPQIEAMGEGATGQTELSRTRLGSEVLVPRPPLAVQRRIADILSAYDDLIENSQRRIRILESMARALYREWFVHFRFPGHEKVPRVPSPLGEIPKGWEVKKVSELTAFLNRGLSPTYDESGDSIVINQKCIRDQRLNLGPARKQSKTIPADKLVRFGDVLINSTGVGTLGRVAQVYEQLEACTVDTHVTIARPLSDTDLDYFGCALLAQQETFERLGVGATGQTELSRAAIGNVELALPTADVQQHFGGGPHGVRPQISDCSLMHDGTVVRKATLIPSESNRLFAEFRLGQRARGTTML